MPEADEKAYGQTAYVTEVLYRDDRIKILRTE